MSTLVRCTRCAQSTPPDTIEAKGEETSSEDFEESYNEADSVFSEDSQFVPEKRVLDQLPDEYVTHPYVACYAPFSHGIATVDR